MKRLFTLLFTLALMLGCCLAFSVHADSVTEGDYTYTVTDGKATITHCNEDIAGNIAIPASLGGYPVTIIGFKAFENCNNITSVTIPDSVTSIENLAFYGCTELTTVSIPDSVTAIGARMFDDCNNLTYFTYNNGKYLGNSSNHYVALIEAVNQSVTTCTIHQDTKMIAPGAFSECHRLSSVAIGNSVTFIGYSAFSGCSSLTSVTIPDSITSINAETFCDCADLNTVIIGNSVASIGDFAFAGCSSLTSVTIPTSVISIGNSAFGCCSSLTSVTIPASVTTIGLSAFGYCNSLSRIWVDTNNPNYSSDTNGVLFNKAKTILIQAPGALSGIYMIPASVTAIGDSAFDSCKSLMSVIIPESVTNINGWAFSSCSNLTSVIIPESVTTIGDYAFAWCKNLISVTIPDSVTTLGLSAFADCNSLTSVTIPSNITSFGGYAFESCNSLTSVTIQEGVTTIGFAAFTECYSLDSVTIPVSVTAIENFAFESLSNVYYAGTEAQWTQITIGVGNEALTSANIHFESEMPGTPDKPDVPAIIQYLTYEIKDGSVTITGCDPFLSGEIIIPDMIEGCPVTAIGNAAFFECEDLTSVVIPEGVISLGRRVFFYLPNLVSVSIPASVTTINDRAFGRCDSLTDLRVDVNNPNYSSDTKSVLFDKAKTTLIWAPGSISGSYTIPSSVNTVNIQAFSWCHSMTSVTIPASVTTIGIGAFDYCDSLSGIWVDTNNPNYSSDTNGVLFNKTKTTLVRAPGNFSGSYTIPSTVDTINMPAFNACHNLTSVAIPTNVTTINSNTFMDCTSLTAVTIPVSVTTIGWSAFWNCNSLNDVYYSGTEEQWAAITLESDNDSLTKATIHYNSAPPVATGDLDGNAAINEDDAIYLLQHVLMPALFLVNQDADFDGNDVIDEDDAIYLLQHVLMPEYFPL